MANKIKQFRYYAENSELNQPQLLSDGTTPVSYTHFITGAVFGDCFPVSQLGVQSLPGTKFFLNNSLDTIIIGTTGIYELELEDQTEITNIQFDSESMKLLEKNDNAHLIVDIIYDDGKEL